MEYVTVHKASNPINADLVRSRLEAAEFHPIVTNDLSPLSMLSTVGVLVQVPPDEAKEAREFLTTPLDADAQ